jgi:hypothetical protein
MNRKDRRAAAAGEAPMSRHDRSRKDRLASFRAASGGDFVTALLPANEHRGPAAIAVANWLLTEAVRRPSCFCCHTAFGQKRRPFAFLTAASDLSPDVIAVSALCSVCSIELTPDTIEEAAIATLRRDLKVRGGFVD